MMRKKILLVDDDQELCEELKEIFNDEGFTVDIICNGNTALKRLQNEHYDILLLDIKIPDISGFEILQTLMDEQKDIKIIVITGRPLNSKITQSNLGYHGKEENLLAFADEVVNKPFNVKRLITLVKNI